MSLFLTAIFPLLAVFCAGLYGPVSLGLVLLAAWRYGLMGASLTGFWAGLWSAVPAGLLLPSLLLPPLVVGCLAGYLVEKRPVLSATQRAVVGLALSALALLLQVALSGYSPALVVQTVLVCWWSWALWSAGLFWVTSFLFPWREW